MNEETIRRQLKTTAERLYRSGLSKASAGDLSRATGDLSKAVRYDKHNEKARNLLGLVWFQQGELGEAMMQWAISEHLNPVGNWATYYLKEINKKEELATNMSQSIELYNEAVALADKDEIDFAITRLKKAIHLNPNYVKAELLLAVCCIETQKYRAALSALDQVAKIDPLNPEAMRYRLYVAQQKRDKSAEDGPDIQDLSRDIYVQQALPEPDIVELSRQRKSRKKAVRTHGLGLQILLFITGVVLGLGVMGFLWAPQKVDDLKLSLDQMIIEQSQLENENEQLREKVNAAGTVLRQIEEGGNKISEVLMAEIKELLEDWGNTAPKSGE